MAMSTPPPNFVPNLDTLITIKVHIAGENRRFKLPLRDLGANILPDKLRLLLAVPATSNVVFERYSDSAGSFITLDSKNPSVYKQLYRAAKAKLKLRIKATVVNDQPQPQIAVQSMPISPDRLTSHCYVPPMNSDPNIPTKDEPSSEINATNTSSVEPYLYTAPLDPASKNQAMDIMTRQAIAQAQAQYARESIDLHLKQLSPNAGPQAESSSASLDGNVGSPIPQKQLFDKGTPVSRSFSARDHFYAELASMSKNNLPCCRPEKSFQASDASFSVYCNQCDKPIPDAHWHCSLCDDGDFDLCVECVEKGELCGIEGHWLIKRFVKNGKVITSVTETMAPKKPAHDESEKEVPGAFNIESKEEPFIKTIDNSRTCNSCVSVFDESNFVTCTVCEDYDLCIPCHVAMKHGHHPGHPLMPASPDTTMYGLAANLCGPGRNMRHYAICDGCDKDIYGVRHKCLNCPDWDFCSACLTNAPRTHPGHRFVPIYETIPFSPARAQRHYGIYCDGPLCKDKGHEQGYIVGDRYKCAVCHDTDFCANCEALPTHDHNRTHPLIKFRSPVRNVSVTTLGEKDNGEVMSTMGDKTRNSVGDSMRYGARRFRHASSESLVQTSSKSTETTPAAESINAATQVQTVAEVKPIEESKADPLDNPVPEEKEEPKSNLARSIPAINLEAHFVRDEVADGSTIAPNEQFVQIWTLRNPGPENWPAGCSVRFIGGDNMLNVNSEHPSSVSDIANATESNVTDGPVEAGEEVEFSITMKTPPREGKAISYWRLKAADGKPFGHRLWCDINVRKPDSAFAAKVEHVEEVEEPMKKEETSEVQPLLVEVDEQLEEETKEEPKLAQSQMIFPTLDKESPVSSTHEVASPQESQPFTSAGAQDLIEVVEELGLEDDEEEESTDDGFLTDEEYTFVDADDDDDLSHSAVNGKSKK